MMVTSKMDGFSVSVMAWIAFASASDVVVMVMEILMSSSSSSV